MWRGRIEGETCETIASKEKPRFSGVFLERVGFPEGTTVGAVSKRQGFPGRHP